MTDNFAPGNYVIGTAGSGKSYLGRPVKPDSTVIDPAGALRARDAAEHRADIDLRVAEAQAQITRRHAAAVAALRALAAEVGRIAEALDSDPILGQAGAYLVDHAYTEAGDSLIALDAAHAELASASAARRLRGQA